MEYEIINPSDECYVSGSDTQAICASVLLLGNGKYGLKDPEGEQLMPPFAFGGAGEWFFFRFKQTLESYLTEENKQKICDVLRTFRYAREQTSTIDIGWNAEQIILRITEKIKKEPQMPKEKNKRIVKCVNSLPCKLTKEELLERSIELSSLLFEKTGKEEALASYQKQVKSEIAEVQAQINQLSQKVYSGKEYRQIDCEWVYDFDKKTKTLFRKDTGEEVNVEIIMEQELQENLDLEKND